MSADSHAAPIVETPLPLEVRPQGLFLGATRALLYSHVAIEMLRKQLFHQVGEELARAILAQAGRHGGFNDAQLLLQEQSFDSLEAMVAAQYGLLSQSGFGAFQIADLIVKKTDGEVYLRVFCHNSPEAESHLRLFGRAEVPVCCHLVGYSSGWASSMTGLQLLTIETRCVAKGDARCEFETLPYQDFVGPEAAFWKRVFENTGLSMARELKDKLTTIEAQLALIQRQRVALTALAAPILQIADGVLTLPMIGAVDSERASIMSERLLDTIVAQRARAVIIDVTGIETLDSQTAQHLSRMAQAARLLGVRVVVSGISPAVAKVLVAQAVGLQDVATYRTLQDALRLLQQQLAPR